MVTGRSADRLWRRHWLGVAHRVSTTCLLTTPRLRLYLMHAGAPYLQEAKVILSVYPQVYVDLAVVNWILPRDEFHGYLRELVRAGFGKRLLFGSD